MADAQALDSPVRQALGRSPLDDAPEVPGAGRSILDALGRHDRKLNLAPAFLAPATVEDLPSYLAGRPVEVPEFVAPEVAEPPMDPEPEPVEVAAPAVSEVVAREAEAPTSLADIRARLLAMNGGPR